MAQTGAPATCTAAAFPNTARVEGEAEFAANYVLTCTGGTPAASGSPVPITNVTLSLNTNATGRLLAPNWSETLLLIDEPGSPLHPAVPQLACGDSAAPETSPGLCTLNGTGTGVTYDGTAGHPNVFQAKMGLTSNAVTWQIPLDAPPSGGTRIVRIANIRTNASALPVSPAGSIMAFIALSGPVTIAVVSPTQTLSLIQQGADFSVPSPAVLGRCTPQNPALLINPAASGTPTLSVRFAEGFPSAWEPRTTAAFIDNNTSPPPVAQNVPGSIYNSETGFYNPSLPVIAGRGNLALAGLADEGTRLRVSFTSIPKDLLMFTQTVGNLVRQSDNLASGGVMRLVSVAADGFGPFVATPGNAFGIAPVPISGGNAVAVFEILKADPLNKEYVDLPIYLAYVHAGHGTAMAAGSLAPVSAAITASLTEAVPRFADTGVPQNAFVLPPPCH